ncbi:hypothetical protein ILUMI_06739 [Ignelater luminosus]|uniref:F-box domain-containing protein n=1 Tax=Ignelater luminosus TaxID=2038154 RepID=A0A8K0GC97_IGNLU|nr:hypothetical protein ILUMI_06739 [Ignelater luminosus]
MEILDLEPPYAIQNYVKNTKNGLYFNNVYIPEEIILYILAFLDPKELLKFSLVCHNWNKFIKSYTLWSTLYRRKYHDKPKQLPWYLLYCLLNTNYFNNNLLKNGNGEEEFAHWHILDGGYCMIENPPRGTDPVPLHVPEFNKQTGCFATAYGYFWKMQNIKLGKNSFFRYIVNRYKPHIYLSEWTACRFNCGCIYKLRCGFVRSDTCDPYRRKAGAVHRVNQKEGSKWEKIEIIITEYPDDIEELIFEHEAHDVDYKGRHCSSKVAGCVLKFLFDSIEPLLTDENGTEKPKMFSELKYDTNVEKQTQEERIVTHVTPNGMCFQEFESFVIAS